MYKKIYNNNFLILIITSSLIYFLWSIKLLNDFPWRYVFTDWIINYEGGYIRRGLLGEISIKFSNLFNVDIKIIFFFIHLFIYLLFHFFFFKFFCNFKRNYLFYFLCFSPLVFLYPIATFEAFARKEIFYITFYLLNCYFLINLNNRNILFFLTNLFVLLSYFIHESSLFFIGFFYLSYFIFLKKKNFKIKISDILIIISIYFGLFYLLTVPVSEQKISEMIFYINQNFFEITAESGAISWLQGGSSDTTLFIKNHNLKIEYILINVLLLHFLIFFFYLLFITDTFKKNKIYYFFTFFIFLSPLVLFLIAADWGRFVYILYNFCLIFTFYNLYDNKIIFIEIDKLSFLKNISLKLKIFFTFLYVSLWSPKIFFFETVDFLPLFDVVIKLYRYSIKYSSILIF